MSKIIDVIGREVLDSRGFPTVEVDIYTEFGSIARASSPSGASIGVSEACELRDNDKSRFLGKGVLNAVQNVNSTIKSAILGQDVFEHQYIDKLLINIDGSNNKKNLGANAIIATSIALVKAAAMDSKKPLYKHLNQSFIKDHNDEDKVFTMPMPLMNIINGGAHANNDLDIQEFMIVPLSAKSIKHAIRMGSEIFHSLRQILDSKRISTSVGDEGGFAFSIKYNRKALDLILDAVDKAGYTAGKDVMLALDVASSEFYRDGKYHLAGENLVLSAKDLIKYYENLISEYPIYSIEDGMSENDFKGWKEMTGIIGHATQLVGDDLFVTNVEILKKGVSQKMANAILVKPNQIGTISETFRAIKYAHSNNYSSIISHRSGETEDTTIAHLAVAWNCNQIKTGSLCRVDRTAKYNELIRIEESLGKNAHIASIAHKRKQGVIA